MRARKIRCWFGIALIFVLAGATAHISQAGEVNGVRAADAAKSKVDKGFVAFYVGESARSETKPEVTIGFAPPDTLVIKVPLMEFHAVHQDGTIRVRSGDEGVVIRLQDVKALTAAAQAKLVALPWLDLPDPGKSPMSPQLSFELASQTLNAGINFGAKKDLFSWHAAMRSAGSVVFDDGETWRVVQNEAGDKYESLISKQSGLLTEMRHQRDADIVRKMVLADVKYEPPGADLLDLVFPNRVTPQSFAGSPAQKSQYLIGVYDGVQERILDRALPRWKSMDLKERQALAAAVAGYWEVVFDNVFASQKESLDKALAEPSLLERVRQKAANKVDYDAFKKALPQEKQADAKKLWADRVLGVVGYELVDPFVGWTRARYLEPAKARIDAEGEKHGVDQKEREKLLAALGLPIIDAGYLKAEPVVLPKILPVIQQAAAGIE